MKPCPLRHALLLLLGAGVFTVAAVEPRVSTERGDVDQPGTAAWLIRHRPAGAWQAGRGLFTREFSRAEGAGEPADRERLADGTRAMRMGHATSCALCHNTPFGDAGAGATIGRIGPSGRSTPHLYGAGLLEALAESIALHLVQAVDADGDGTISPGEAAGRRAIVPTGDGSTVDYGRYDDQNGDGAPDLDPAVRWWPVGRDGRRRPGANLGSAEVVGYRLAVMAYGWSGEDATADGSTSLRAFLSGAFALHAGLQAQDSCAPGPCGAPQVTVPVGAPVGARDSAAVNPDDPDRDGIVAELSAGDLDLVEWYLLNHPAPRETQTADAGRRHFAAIGCTDCHVPAWNPPTRVRDRRAQIHGEAPVSLTAIPGIYSDLRHHDLGPAFHQVRWDGSVITRFRTPPLWGVATSAPYGHDGESLDLDEVIRRHGGEATAATVAYARLSDSERSELIGFLGTLTLWRIGARDSGPGAAIPSPDMHQK